MTNTESGLILSFEIRNLDTGTKWTFVGVNVDTNSNKEELNNVHLDEDIFELADDMNGWTDEFLHFDHMEYEEEFDLYDFVNERFDSIAIDSLEDAAFLKVIVSVADADADDSEVDEFLRQIVFYFEEDPWNLEISNIECIQED